MTITETDLRTRFPTAFPAAFPSAILTAAIAEAEVRIDRTTLGGLADSAVLYLAAHVARVDALAQNAGVSSASAGGVSVSFNNASADQLANGFYSEYLRIVRLATAGISLSGMIG